MCWFQAFVFLVGWSPMSLSLDSPGFTWLHLDSPGFTWILLLAFPLPSLPFVRQCDQRCSNEVCRHGKSTESTESTVQALHVSWRSVLREEAPTWYRWRHRSPSSAGYEKLQNLLKSAEVWFRKIPFEEVSWTWLLKRSFQPGPCRQAWSRLARDLRSHGPIVFWDLKVVKGKGLKQLCNACNAARFPLSYSSSLRCLRNWDLPPKRKCKASWSLRCQHQNARV